MHRNKVLVCAMAAVLFCSAVVMAETVQVRFFDGNQQLITNETVAVRDAASDREGSQKLAPNPDGEYSANLMKGQKILFTVGDGPQARRFEAIVPVHLDGPLDLFSMEPATATQAPVNDTCEMAVAVGDPSLTAGTNLGAGYEGAPTCVTTHSGGPDVWYSVIGSGREMTATFCLPPGTAEFDTKLTVYEDGCDMLTCVTDNDDDFANCGVGPSTVVWNSEAGKEYLILVHGFLGDAGDFELYVESAPATGACCSCLNEPFNCTVEADDVCLAMGSEFQGDGTQCLMATAPPTIVEVMADDPISVDLPPVVSTLNFPTSMIIGDLDVDVILDHTWIGDLVITVTHPSGAPSVDVWNRSCGSTDNIDVIYDDDTTTGDLCSDYQGGGHAYPDNPLSAFDGLDAMGDWTITIEDFVGGDDGTFLQWSLHVSGPLEAICVPFVPGDDEDFDDEYGDDPYGGPDLLGVSGDTLGVDSDVRQFKPRTGTQDSNRQPGRR